MKAAGFNVVRMGHLAWDSYEPSEGFSILSGLIVMDEMLKADMKVILDIAIRPAPSGYTISIPRSMWWTKMEIASIRTIVTWTIGRPQLSEICFALYRHNDQTICKSPCTARLWY